MLIDTHAHLNFKAFKDDYREAIKRAFDARVSLINVGSSLKTSKKAVEIAQEYEKGVYAAAGIHPVHVDKMENLTAELKELERLSQNPKVVAFGETGLDYFHDKETKPKQIYLLQEMLNLALRLDLPLILHCRDAFEDLIEILQSARDKQYPIRGVVHCFSGNLDHAQEILDLGLHISFTGNITYPKSEKLAQVVAEVPLDKIMLETDAPYLAPLPYRKKK